MLRSIRDSSERRIQLVQEFDCGFAGAFAVPLEGVINLALRTGEICTTDI